MILLFTVFENSWGSYPVMVMLVSLEKGLDLMYMKWTVGDH